MIRVVEAAGFRVEVWRDTTTHTLAWFHHLRERLAARAPSGGDDDSGPLGHAVLDGYIETLEVRTVARESSLHGGDEPVRAVSGMA